MLLRQTLFWDADINVLNFKTHQNYIIGRVAERGNLIDWKELFANYSQQTIKQTLMSLPYLDERTLNYCSLYFSEPQTAFKCYEKIAFQKKHWLF